MEAEMTICAFASIFTQAGNPHTVSKARLLKVAAFAAGLGLGTLSFAAHAAPASGGDTVRGLYDALLNTMKNGRTLGQSGRFAKLDPVIRRSFDIAEMARLSLGRSWTGLSDAQRQQMTESYGRYTSGTTSEQRRNQCPRPILALPSAASTFCTTPGSTNPPALLRPNAGHWVSSG